MARKSKTTKEPEFEPDAWSRFERAVDVVAKSPPQHRTKSKQKVRKSPAKRSPKRASSTANSEHA
jgi:hypothetical protein